MLDKNPEDGKIVWGLGGGILSIHSSLVCMLICFTPILNSICFYATKIFDLRTPFPLNVFDLLKCFLFVSNFLQN